METDGYDPYEDKEARALAAREHYERGLISDAALRQLYEQRWIPSAIDGWHPGMGGGGGGGGGSVHYGGGGGGAGFSSQRVFLTDDFNRLIPDLDLLGQPFRVQVQGNQIKNINRITEEERQEMEWSSPDARDIAREILSEEKREGLREKVTEAIAGYREMLADAHCGSVFSFMKKNDKGEHYWYAAIKNGGKWYTTAQSPRVLENDDALIEWLVLLQAYESEATELTAGAAHKALALGPVDTTATEVDDA